MSIPLLIYVGERTLRALRSKAYAVKILKVNKFINILSGAFIVSVIIIYRSAYFMNILPIHTLFLCFCVASFKLYQDPHSCV
jgi:hypothetical protein